MTAEELEMFGEAVPGEAVKPTYFDPCDGYRPRGQYVLRTVGTGYARIDADAPRKDNQMTPQTAAMTAPADRQPATVTSWPKQQIDLVRRTVAVGATDDELALYLYDCERRGIHPLDKLLHFTKRGGKYTPVTSIDFMRAQAAMSGEMAGSEDPAFVETDGKLTAATVTVYRITQGQRFPYTATARWAEYCPDNAQMWRRMPHTMLGKCAEALALRKAFPQQLAGLYSSEEMDQSGGQALPAITSPARSEAREKPVAATVENRGALSQTPVAQAASTSPRPSVTIPSVPNGGVSGRSDDGPDLGTADADGIPDGFALIRDYKLDGDWHQVWWGRDGSDGVTQYKTKLAKIGLEAHNAFTERHPVKLHSKKPPFLDRVESLGMSAQDIKATKFNPDDDRFCDGCGRPAAECLC